MKNQSIYKLTLSVFDNKAANGRRTYSVTNDKNNEMPWTFETISRDILVTADTTLFDLHNMIQRVFALKNTGLHCFSLFDDDYLWMREAIEDKDSDNEHKKICDTSADNDECAKECDNAADNDECERKCGISKNLMSGSIGSISCSGLYKAQSNDESLGCADICENIHKDMTGLYLCYSKNENIHRDGIEELKGVLFRDTVDDRVLLDMHRLFLKTFVYGTEDNVLKRAFLKAYDQSRLAGVKKKAAEDTYCYAKFEAMLNKADRSKKHHFTDKTSKTTRFLSG